MNWQSFNWQAVSALCAVFVALVAFANYLMLMRIELAITRQTDALKDWARKEFATEKETNRRLAALEAARAHK